MKIYSASPADNYSFVENAEEIAAFPRTIVPQAP